VQIDQITTAHTRVLGSHIEINGAPRPMKMGTTASPWRYDAAASQALQSAICDGQRCRTPPHDRLSSTTWGDPDDWNRSAE